MNNFFWVWPYWSFNVLTLREMFLLVLKMIWVVRFIFSQGQIGSITKPSCTKLSLFVVYQESTTWVMTVTLQYYIKLILLIMALELSYTEPEEKVTKSNPHSQPSSTSGEWKMLLISSRSGSLVVPGALYVVTDLMMTQPMLCVGGWARFMEKHFCMVTAGPKQAQFSSRWKNKDLYNPIPRHNLL